MGRAGRYTLSVMVWVAAYAGWSSLIGLVVAATTGDRPRDISVGASALMTVVGPLVPTLVALWFNDWGRDGFPTREQRRAAAAAPREVPVAIQHPVHVTPVPAPAPVSAPPLGDLPVVPAHPLGVPAAAAQPATSERFPVAPLLRDGDRRL